MRTAEFIKNFSKLFILDTSQTFRNEIIVLLMIAAIILPIISTGSVYDYIAIFTLMFLFLNPQPSALAFPCH